MPRHKAEVKLPATPSGVNDLSPPAQRSSPTAKMQERALATRRQRRPAVLRPRKWPRTQPKGRSSPPAVAPHPPPVAGAQKYALTPTSVQDEDLLVIVTLVNPLVMPKPTGLKAKAALAFALTQQPSPLMVLVIDDGQVTVQS